MNSARFSVAEFTEETISLMPIGCLCIFLRKYSWAGLGLARGRQKLVILGDSRPCLLSLHSVLLMVFAMSMV